MKSKLINQINTTLLKYSQGTNNHRETMRKMLTNIVKDMLDLKIMPPGFHHMTSTHVTQLTDLWKTKGNSQATMINKLGALRTFNTHGKFNITIPTNAELDIQKQKQYRLKYLSEDIVHQVESKITAIILKMQLSFGLTKYEVIRLPVANCVVDADLYIPTNIAYNRKKRVITMYKPEQRETINELRSIIGGLATLGEMATERHIAQLYNAELALLKIDYNANFRAIYGYKRLASLMKKGITKDDAYKLLMEEMGYSEKKILLEAIL